MALILEALVHAVAGGRIGHQRGRQNPRVAKVAVILAPFIILSVVYLLSQ
jgi:hypothetical protein